jgi:hypothetical protein
LEFEPERRAAAKRAGAISGEETEERRPVHLPRYTTAEYENILSRTALRQDILAPLTKPPDTEAPEGART